MSFITDKQTSDELNLMGKFRNGSVYNLFCKVKTGGGERLLESMFNRPLEDGAAINQRSSVFRYFQDAGHRFPFDVQQVSLMNDFLDTGLGKGVTQLMADILVKKTLSALVSDERYKKIVQGLQATVMTLQRCYTFIAAIQSSEGKSAYNSRIQRIKEILSNKKLEALSNIDIYKPLSLSTLVTFSHLLKSVVHREMSEILDFIFELDVNITVSDVSRVHGFAYAQALPLADNVFTARGLRHPCIEKAVGNDLILHKNSNVLFLTGANMAGKSTFMKSVGIGLYLAHMGFPVAAAQMEFSVREGMYSSINVADNIHLGYSHFYAEVVRVKQAAEAAASGKKLLLMFDELFKGTNVKDAYDGTLAVTESFADYDDCLFVVSTHIIEVGEALKNTDNIQFAFMPTIMDGVHPKYTYQLREGITEDRQGMMIIRNEGILELLTDA